VPPPFQTKEWSLGIPRIMSSSALAAGPIGVQKIRDTGPDNNRVVIVVMGDGYTAANLTAGAFTSAAASLDVAFRSKSPWNSLFAATNLYRVDIESNQQGADNETFGVYKDTYLNSSFWVNDIERLLALTGDGYYRAVVAADNLVGPGVWDVILVLVNSTKYGGSGGGIAVASVHSTSSEIILHELGHSFANLADEYETAYPGYPAGDYEPNVDYDYAGPGLKWLIWVDPGTPLPTPEASPYPTAVGAFEGARYLSTGIYRPWYNCEMRSLSQQFCPVCREAHVLEFTNMVSLTDNVDPVPGTIQNVTWSGTQFSATPLPFSDLQYEWTLDGVPISGETSPTLVLTSDELLSHEQTLALTITFNTPLVRKQVMTAGYTWPVVATVGTCCTGIVGDANNNGGYEPTISDVQIIVDHLFISRAPLVCYAEADANQSGGSDPKSSDVTISDVALLVDHLFVTRAPLRACF
ncbi:MAG: M64 family metallo-endopeptidase, partial [candidate division Zixibacteria bacterium]|nr:M64 family metallo-endopeptidase [candidate division Zixibacteria bacterium]